MELTENERFLSSPVEREKETTKTVKISFGDRIRIRVGLISIFFLADKTRNVSV